MPQTPRNKKTYYTSKKSPELKATEAVDKKISSLTAIVSSTVAYPNNTIEDYISSFEVDLYVYSGFIKNNVPVIKRCKDSIEEVAQSVTDLATDWTNRLILTYI